MADRIYYVNPALSSFDARVSDIREASRSEGRSLWQISLDRSAFYPTSGGQPHDTGLLTATSPGGSVLEVPVLAVEEDEQGEVWHTTPKPLSAGTAVRGYIDWSRRRDHMQQHSGQHLLSAVIYRQLGAPTISFHLGEMSSTIDLAREAMTEEELEHIEDSVNEIIAENRPVTVRTIPRHEAEMLLAAGTLLKLPERSGNIRLIEIDETDLNACGGTHVQATGQIGGLHIRGIERMRQGVRIAFVCGLRAAVTARHDLSTLGRAATLLSISRSEVADGVERLQAENKTAHKAVQRLTEQLAAVDAKSILASMGQKPATEGRPVLRQVWNDREDATYLNLVASQLISETPNLCVLLAATQQEPARVVAAAGAEVKVHCGTLMREALAPYGLRGGGSPRLAQGQISKAHLDALLDHLEEAFRTA